MGAKWEIVEYIDASLPAEHPAKWMYEVYELDANNQRYVDEYGNPTMFTMARGFVTREDAIADAERCCEHHVIWRESVGQRHLADIPIGRVFEP